MTEEHPKAASIFICYASEDRVLLNDLHKHFASLIRLNHIIMWYKVEIQEDAQQVQQILARLRWASITLFIISSDFMISDNCHRILQTAVERKSTHVVPILLRPTDYEDTPISGLQMLPSTAQPITTWLNRDEAYLDVVRGIRRMIASLLTDTISPGEPIVTFRQGTTAKVFRDNTEDEMRDLLTFCEQGISLDPYNMLFYKMKIRMLAQGTISHFKVICEVCEEAIQKFPDELYFRDIRSRSGWISTSEWFLEEEYEKLLPINPWLLDLYKDKAHLLCRMERYEEAIGVYRQFLALYHEVHIHVPKQQYPDFADTIAEEISALETSAIISRRRTFIYTNDPDIRNTINFEYYRLGVLLYLTRQYEEAIKALDVYIYSLYRGKNGRDKTYLPMSYVVKGKALRALGKRKEASLAYKEAKEISPGIDINNPGTPAELLWVEQDCDID